MRKMTWRREYYKIEGDEEYSTKHIGRIGKHDACFIIESAGSSDPSVFFIHKDKSVSCGSNLFSIEQIKREVEKQAKRRTMNEKELR